MNISYDKISHLYVLGNSTYTKQQFLSYIESDMLQSALANKSSSFDIEELNLPLVEPGKNLIITGAPGTGKSHYTNNKYSLNSIRCVFHSEYTNSNFVGMYKPIPVKNTDSITYQFVPGPFTQALVNAYNDPNQMHNLIIEEINRADASAVFGELFQLLDRDENGTSDFPININPELQEFLANAVHSTNINLMDMIQLHGKIIIPSNLNIIATMNSSDQGVFTLDTAFKRRWIFKFIDINFQKCPYKDSIIEICGQKISWENFATTINAYMMQNELPEDRQLGPFFLKENELNDSEIFSSKLLYYIWNDVARYDKEIYFSNILTFSELCKKFKDGLNIFSDSLYKKLENLFI